jgi:hypothetical protein
MGGLRLRRGGHRIPIWRGSSEDGQSNRLRDLKVTDADPGGLKEPTVTPASTGGQAPFAPARLRTVRSGCEDLVATLPLLHHIMHNV